MAFFYAHGWDDGDHGGGSFSIPAGLGVDIAGFGRTGTRCLHFFGNGGALGYWQSPVFPTVTGNGWVYVAHRSDTFPSSETPMVSILNLDSGTVHLTLNRTTSSKYRIRRGDGTQVGGDSTIVAPTGGFTQVAFKYKVADAGGVAELRVNGSTVNEITFAGDTQNGGIAGANCYRVHNHQGASDFWFDDVIFQDDTGPAPENDWAGDICFDTKLATADGDEIDFTAFPSGTRFSNINEIPPSGTQGVQSNVVGDEILFQYGALSSINAQIFAVAPYGYLQKAGAGLREVAYETKLSGTTDVGPTRLLSSSYQRYQNFFHRRPGGALWLPADTPQAGAKVIT